MITLGEYVEGRLDRMVEKSSSVQKLLGNTLDMSVNKTSIIIDFYHVDAVEHKGELYSLVPIGTKHKPAGISLIEDCFIIFKKDNTSVGYIHVADLREYIRINIEKLPKRHSEEYKLAVVIKLKDLL